MRLPECHTERKHYALGLCRNCYVKHRAIKDPEKHRQQKKGRYVRWKNKHPEYDRDKALLTKYGLTGSDVDIFVEEYGCFICRSKDGSFHVDHCHGTGKVRGILCARCNHGLGNFRDSVELLLAAVRYLNEKNGP